MVTYTFLVKHDDTITNFVAIGDDFRDCFLKLESNLLCTVFDSYDILSVQKFC